MQFKQLLKKTLIFGFGVIGVSVVFSLLVGEFIVKHVMPQQTYSLARAQGLNIFETSPLLPYTIKKNVDQFFHIAYTREFTHHASTNSHGIRGKEFTDEKPADTYRILFLGDSITFGWGVEDEDAYPAVVEKYLSQALKKDKYQRVEVVNAGFTDGNSPDTYYLYYKEIGASYHPDLVIANFHPPNDISDIQDHSWDKVDENNLPLSISSKTYIPKDGYMVSRKKTKWKYEIPILRNWHLGILFFDALEKGAPQVVDKIKQALHIEDDTPAVTPSQTEECLQYMEKKHCVDELWKYVDTPKVMFTALKKEVEANQAEFIVTLMPGPNQVRPLSTQADRLTLLPTLQPQKYYADYFLAEKFTYFDFTPALIAQNADGIFYHLDGHINKYGHAVVAKALTVELLKLKPDLFLQDITY